MLSCVATSSRCLPGLVPYASRNKIVRSVASFPDFDKYRDVSSLHKLWFRSPIRSTELYPKEQQPFVISRSDDSGRFREKLCIQGMTSNVVYNPHKVPSAVDIRGLFYAPSFAKNSILLLGAEQQIPSLPDLIAGNQEVFLTVLDAVAKRNLQPLRPLTLGSSTLEAHRQRVSKLSDVQIKALSVKRQDFVGLDGFVWNYAPYSCLKGTIYRYVHDVTFVGFDAAGEVLDKPHFKYTVVLAALLGKDQLYKKVRELPFDASKLRKEDSFVRQKMDKNYGFVAPRYTVMRIEMAHKVLKPLPTLTLDEDAYLYDFHIHSF